MREVPNLHVIEALRDWANEITDDASITEYLRSTAEEPRPLNVAFAIDRLANEYATFAALVPSVTQIINDVIIPEARSAAVDAYNGELGAEQEVNDGETASL